MTFNYQQHQSQDGQPFQQITTFDQVLLQPIQNSDQNLFQRHPQNLSQQSYGQQIQQAQNYVHQQIQSYGHNDDDPLILRISGRLSMIKDCIMTMNQQYTELEQDFIRLRLKYNRSC
ncbi:4930_t:CDS:2 [Entrophospora sp. SA101]|nr:6328_t:CDS:2 [Entrophospora sp. SA101]CAJ0769514.1 4930_t:CDS:2 [Entrophospora sp. SA101]CAJ0826745.1 14611_t:CDS:2 [Entrophospora sp. SA101]CAJ0847002.1 16086_t:CDS:2 [Entrophospora sp. SA101]